ncbi:MAG: heavy-metal-associated domain-containing protein [Gammaproteobacteria bacterium]
METVTFTIKGMHCQGCAQIIESVLARLEGVQTCSVSYRNGSAQVLFDPVRVRRESLARAVEKAGYRIVAKT